MKDRPSFDTLNFRKKLGRFAAETLQVYFNRLVYTKFVMQRTVVEVMRSLLTWSTKEKINIRVESCLNVSPGKSIFLPVKVQRLLIYNNIGHVSLENGVFFSSLVWEGSRAHTGILKKLFYHHGDWSVMFFSSSQEQEANPLCRRLPLRGIISTQMQRLTKYPLFIGQLLKYSQRKTFFSFAFSRPHYPPSNPLSTLS